MRRLMTVPALVPAGRCNRKGAKNNEDRKGKVSFHLQAQYIAFGLQSWEFFEKIKKN